MGEMPLEFRRLKFKMRYWINIKGHSDSHPIDRSQNPPTLSYCCYARHTMHYTCSHAVKNTSQSKEETDNTLTEKTEQVTSGMKQGLRTLSFKLSFLKKFKQ